MCSGEREDIGFCLESWSTGRMHNPVLGGTGALPWAAAWRMSGCSLQEEGTHEIRRSYETTWEGERRVHWSRAGNLLSQEKEALRVQWEVRPRVQEGAGHNPPREEAHRSGQGVRWGAHTPTDATRWSLMWERKCSCFHLFLLKNGKETKLYRYLIYGFIIDPLLVEIWDSQVSCQKRRGSL